MTELDETRDLAVVLSNIRRKKRPDDLVTVARAFQQLISAYGSRRAVADKVKLSPEMVREFLSILTLPRKILRMVKSRNIDRVDEAYRISKIKDPSQQLEAANRSVKMLTDDIRDVESIVSRRGKSFREAQVAVRESKLRGLHVFIIEIEDSHEKVLSRVARKQQLCAADLVKNIIIDWLKRHSRESKSKRGL